MIWQRVQRALYPLPMAPQITAPTQADYADLFEQRSEFVAAAVLLGLVERKRHEPTILLTRRTERLSQHAGQVALPGGRIDPTDVDEVGAALREANEEIGLQFQHVEPLGFVDPICTITGFRVVPVVARIDPAHVSRPCADEVAEIFEVPLDFILEPSNAHRVQTDFQGKSRHYWQFEYRDQRIWGATAMMLLNLRDRMTASGR